MADSKVAPAGKRERLVASAGELLHQQGVGGTTLADIAQAAAVPVGNVYYYFKTKDDLVRAVIEAQTDQVDAMLTSFDALPQPAERLKALVRRWEQMRDVVARYGCPFGTLASELDRRDDGLDLAAAGPIRRILDWAEIQIRHLGHRDARELATTLFAGVQGGALLASALRDPDLMSTQVRHLERWIDTLAGTPPPL
jgi:TetR/AcrR family transcriptional repressor of nem operon